MMTQYHINFSLRIAQTLLLLIIAIILLMKPAYERTHLLVNSQPTLATSEPSAQRDTPRSKVHGQTGTPLARLANFIIPSEGVRTEPYPDSEGNITIGAGRNLEGNGISIDELEAIIGTPDYRHILKNAEVRANRIYISTLQSAKNIFTEPLTKENITLLLMDDLKNVETEVKEIFGKTWETIDATRQTVIMDILYNLGAPHFKGFHDFIAAVKAHDWENAAKELLMSKAAREDIVRYHNNATILQTGQQL